jgi:serine/threonine-protein kinase
MTSEGAAPKIIGERYEVLGRLGSGGMGTVYRALDTRLGRVVAIKTILPHFIASEQASARFLREARALAALNHPNILTLYDSGQHRDLHYLVTEVGGRDLGQLLEEGPLGAAQALDVARGIAAAVAYAHGLGIVHRDLKPANVLVGLPLLSSDGGPPPLRLRSGQAPPSPRGRGSGRAGGGELAVKVMDFGLAKWPGATAITAATAQIGTAQYMSPEQIVGRRRMCGRTFIRLALCFMSCGLACGRSIARTCSRSWRSI